MNTETLTKIEATVFRKLINHFDEHKDVQNIDLMLLASFCRNCLAKWYVDAAKQNGEEIDYEEAREKIYGMPYSRWKEEFQTPADTKKMAAFDKKFRKK